MSLPDFDPGTNLSGGFPLVPFHRVVFAGNELTYVSQAAETGALTGGGPFSTRARAALESLHGGARTLLTPSCTHALELAAVLLGLRPGVEVIVPSYTFVSTANAFALHGARPVFVDVDPDTLGLDPNAAEAAITERARAICVTHYGGMPATPAIFAKLAAKHGIMLIEDNAHGLGGRFNNQPLGTFGSVSALSFSAQKNITSGEGGALVVNDPELVARAEIVADRGTDRAHFSRGDVEAYTWVDVGSNWVLGELPAAVLAAQLERFEQIQRQRSDQWGRYAAGLGRWAALHDVRLPTVPPGCEHTAHIFHLRFSAVERRTAFIAHLDRAGVQASFHYQALNVSRAGRRFGGRPGQCPVAEEAAETLVRLPLHAAMSGADQDRVIGAVLDFTE